MTLYPVSSVITFSVLGYKISPLMWYIFSNKIVSLIS